MSTISAPPPTDDGVDYPSSPKSPGENNYVRQLSTDSATNNAQNENDVAWSLCSNCFFITGGVLYLAATIWDFIIYTADPNADIHTVLGKQYYLFYEILWFMVPLVYLFNSFVDVKWSLKVRDRDVAKRQLEQLLLNGSDSTQYEHVETEPNAIIGIPSSPNGSPAKQITKKRRRIKQAFTRLRQHFGHRRELAAAATFGIAAFLSVLGAICGLIAADTQIGNDETWDAWAMDLESLSIHVYLMSAVFALWKPWTWGSNDCDCVGDDGDGRSSAWHSNVESLETLGDLFFGLASVVDVFLEDSAVDDDILWWPIVSAVLWTLDALLYLRGDFVSLYFLTLNAMVSVASDEDEDEGKFRLEMSRRKTELAKDETLCERIKLREERHVV